MGCETIQTSASGVKTPIHVNYLSQDGLWNITSDWNDELEKKVVAFILSTPFEFYATGKPPSEKDAQNLVRNARERAEAGIPFTRFVVLDVQGKVLGEFAIGFNRDPRKLELAIRVPEDDRKMGSEVLNWCFKEYLPELYRKGFRFPVFARGQNSVPWGEKLVSEWIDLKNMTVVATAHPDHDQGNERLLEQGFVFVEQVTRDAFSGVHDGRRNLYELALETLL